jgi:hypothetical protein
MNRIISLLFLSIALTFAAPVDTVTAQAPSAKEQVEQAKTRLKSAAEAIKSTNDSLRTERAAQQAVYDAQNKRTEGIIWLVVVAFLLLSSIGVWVKYKHTVMGLIRIFTGGFRVKGDVSTPESKKILTGAIYASQQGAILNTLRADVGPKLFTILGDWWGINGRDSAIETLDYLRDKGFAYYFPTVFKAAQATSVAERKEIIIASMTNQEDADKAYSQTTNLLDSVEILTKNKLIRTIDDVERYGVAGWDTGRLIFIARLCYDARYISEQEAWDYIDAAYAQAQRAFNTWDDLARSYVIGRFLWTGKDADDGMQLIAEDLLSKAKSPWKQVGWK